MDGLVYLPGVHADTRTVQECPMSGSLPDTPYHSFRHASHSRPYADPIDAVCHAKTILREARWI